jgi:YegS/Rv2252/BmrU family lipid kinase
VTAAATFPTPTATTPAKAPAARASTTDWFVIWNPAAGNGGGARQWHRYERALRAAGVGFEVTRTGGPGEASKLAAEALRAGHRQFLVAGGDGSAHEVANGLLQAPVDDDAIGIDTPGFVRPAPLIVPVPLGTGNDWARSLGLPRDPSRFAAVVGGRHDVVRHDAGRMRFASAPDTPRWFVNVAGAGFDADVIASMPPRVPSRFAYLWHALRRLGRYASPVFRITGADGVARETRLLLAFVALGQYCGHAMRVAPMARCDDGVFDVITIADVGLVRALPKLARLYRGTLLEDPLVTRRTEPALRIEAVPAAPVEADGQLVGTTPVRFDVVPGALRVLRPT